MIVLDTNVISEFNKPRPSDYVLDWFSKCDDDELFLNDITVMELTYGAEKHRLKTGSKKYQSTIDHYLKGRFVNRILGWAPGANFIAGRIRAKRDFLGHSISVQDAMIAAICIFHGASLATRNVKDFEGLDLPLINPFEGP